MNVIEEGGALEYTLNFSLIRMYKEEGEQNLVCAQFHTHEFSRAQFSSLVCTLRFSMNATQSFVHQAPGEGEC